MGHALDNGELCPSPSCVMCMNLRARGELLANPKRWIESEEHVRSLAPSGTDIYPVSEPSNSEGPSDYRTPPSEYKVVGFYLRRGWSYCYVPLGMSEEHAKNILACQWGNLGPRKA